MAEYQLTPEELSQLDKALQEMILTNEESADQYFKQKSEMSAQEYEQALRDEGCYDDGFYDEDPRFFQADPTKKTNQIFP